jgi:hypothetical protein
MHDAPSHVWPVLHLVHGLPPPPHVLLPLVWQILFVSQQPLHDEVVSQMQSLPLQRWPGLQVEHCSPPTTQMSVPLQQPLAHEVVVHLHRPALHSSPASHFLHVNPPVPHAALLPASWQMPFSSQHPLGQEVGVHAHLP